MATFLMILLVSFAVLGVVFFLLSIRRGGENWHLAAATICGFLTVAAGIGFFEGGSYIAGQGDAPVFAEEWTKKWHPGAEVDCQARDTDDNGYVSCTVGKPGGKIEAIECGVNRWYQGWRTTGCRLMKGYSGSQP